jgi:hypothetical protein
VNDNKIQNLLTRAARANYKPTKEPPILTIKGNPIGSKQSFVCFQGLPKAGKSLYITSAIASAFSSKDIFGMKITLPDNKNKIAYFDTEGSEYDFYQIVNRLEWQIGRNNLPENLQLFNCREDSPAEIIELINTYLQLNGEIGCLIIDGILDLVNDFNNIVECNQLIQWLKKITKNYNMLVMVVLHLGKKDKMSLGHLGSFLDRKSQSVLIIEKEKNIMTMKAQYLRSCENFVPISVHNVNGNWVETSEGLKVETSLYGLEKDSLIRMALIEPLPYKQLVDSISERTGKGATTVKKIIKDWIADGSIIKSGNNYKQKPN